MEGFGKLCLLALVVCTVALPKPRSVIQFGDMIRCLTDRNIINSWLDYDGYGCYCGFGGTGIPLDGTDRCCVTHDNCYGTVMNSGLCPYESHVYIINYDATITNCRASNAAVTCKKAEDYHLLDSPWNECAAAMCECDRAGAECFAANYYDQSLKNWPQDRHSTVIRDFRSDCISIASVKMTAFKKLCLFATTVTYAAAATIHTTNLVQLGDMIGCLTDRSFLRSFLDYEGYGCWCGLGGTGTPLDGTDECCMIHDNCYGAVTARVSCPFDESTYVAVYEFSTFDCHTPSARAICTRAEDYGGFSEWKDCQEAICKCDRAAAECFAANAFDTTNTNWDKDSC
ncbi:uncharacterized protein LOC117297787 [Asterias rubens]|uniref:uncharacterized protein LOC117297787 n=1 Tax=Asterias rubens TaxID=7604 RepID=UPI001455C5DD|nr:uncharacterized protein LOC117297787 [Asterias rubens]